MFPINYNRGNKCRILQIRSLMKALFKGLVFPFLVSPAQSEIYAAHFITTRSDWNYLISDMGAAMENYAKVRRCALFWLLFNTFITAMLITLVS